MATTWYIKIFPSSRPNDIGVDIIGRARSAFNIYVEKRESSTGPEEIVALLVAAGLGTFGTDIFISTKVAFPPGDGPFLSVIETGGPPPIYVQNQSNPAYDRVTFEIVARATTYPAAKAKATAAYNALKGVKNQNVTF